MCYETTRAALVPMCASGRAVMACQGSTGLSYTICRYTTVASGDSFKENGKRYGICWDAVNLMLVCTPVSGSPFEWGSSPDSCSSEAEQQQQQQQHPYPGQFTWSSCGSGHATVPTRCCPAGHQAILCQNAIPRIHSKQACQYASMCDCPFSIKCLEHSMVWHWIGVLLLGGTQWCMMRLQKLYWLRVIGWSARRSSHQTHSLHISTYSAKLSKILRTGKKVV